LIELTCWQNTEAMMLFTGSVVVPAAAAVVVAAARIKLNTIVLKIDVKIKQYVLVHRACVSMISALRAIT